MMNIGRTLKCLVASIMLLTVILTSGCLVVGPGHRGRGHGPVIVPAPVVVVPLVPVVQVY